MRNLFNFLIIRLRVFGSEHNGIFYIHFEQVLQLMPSINVIDFETAPLAFEFLFNNVTTANMIEMYEDDFSMKANRSVLETLNKNRYYEN